MSYRELRSNDPNWCDNYETFVMWVLLIWGTNFFPK